MKLLEAVEKMGTKWKAIETEQILPGRSAQTNTNFFYTVLKYESVIEHDVVSIEGAYDAKVG